MAENEKIFVLSDGSQTNSKGFKVLLTGGRLERFNANPVMLYGHDEEKLIGRWELLSIANNKMQAKPVFDLKNEFAAEKARQVEEGFLKGASIGIMPYKLEVINDEYVMTDWELIEASICTIPADAGAIVLYNEKREQLSFDQVKLNFNLNNNHLTNQAMTEIKLSAKTIESLDLGSDYTGKDVDLAVAEKDKEIADLKLKLDNQNKERVEDYLNGAVKAGKINETEKLSFVKLAANDFDSVKAIIDAKGEQASTSLKEMEAKSNLSAGRETWDYLKWMKDDPKGLQALKNENPKEFERLQATIKK
jgi:HK97 family phage prohead protease